MGYSGAGGKLIHKKTRSKKSRDTVPLSKSLDKITFDWTMNMPCQKGEKSLLVELRWLTSVLTEREFLNFKATQESVPRNQFPQPM
jgi:hypothetical protein